MTKCCVCNETIVDDLYFMPDESHSSFVFCDNCYRSLQKLSAMPTEEEYHEIDMLFSEFVRNREIPLSVRDTYRDADDIYWKNKELEDKYEAAYKRAVEDLLLTSGSLFDGYTVVKYLDVISSEIFFINSFLKPFSSSASDLVNYLNNEDSEITQTMDLLDILKNHTMEHFRKKAVDIGANAVLGVTFDTAFGSDIVKISASGTAVIIEKTE